MSQVEMMHCIATTDAELTFAGEPINPLEARPAQKTMIIYGSSRVGNVCGGRCTVYNGGATCLAAPDTNCLSVTKDIGFCNQTSCGGMCTELVNYIQQLSNKFCFTPGTNFIVVSNA